jgi:cholesterol oxidase
MTKPEVLKDKSMSRRRFVKASAATGLFTQLEGAALGSWSGARTFAPEHQAVIIVGSGFGGAVSALRLTEKGQKVTLLERGQRWTVEEGKKIFSSLLTPDGRSAWLSNQSPMPVGPKFPVRKYAGVLENKSLGGLQILAGAGYGGGSIVYGGVFVKPKRELYNLVFPKEISYDEMQPYYDIAAEMMGQGQAPEDVIQAESYRHARVMKSEADRAGLITERVDCAIKWDLVRDEVSGKRPASISKGESVMGVNGGAKVTLDMTYLAQAEKTGLLDVRTLHQVKSVGVDADGRYTLEVEEIDVRGNVIAIRPMTCDFLFLNAGVMGTTGLLVKARDTGTLPKLNEHVGDGFGNNGNAYALRLGIKEPVGRLQGGPPIYSIVDINNGITPVYIEHPQLPLGLDVRALMYFSVGINPTRGRFFYDRASDEVKLDWPDAEHNDQSKVNEVLMKNMDQLNRVNGGWTSTVLDNFNRPFNDRAVYHALGGCVMGKATDFYGRVKNYDRLYVMDGSLIPGSAACTNPSMTITAMAERCIEDILAKDI